MSSRTEEGVSIVEAKAVGTFRKKKRNDLRALEAQARAVVHGKKYARTVKTKTAETNVSIERLKNSYETRLTKQIVSYERSAISFRDLVAVTSNDVRITYLDAFNLGLKSQGHGAFSKKTGTRASATSEDRAWLKSAADEEIRFLKRFLSEIKHGDVPDEGDEGTSRKMKKGRRIRMYADTLDGIYAAGRVRGAPENAVFHWVYGHAEHCPECIYLQAHSPYTKKSLPTTPRAGSTRCLTNCKCKIVIDVPKLRVFEVIDAKQKTKTYYVRKLKTSRLLKYGLPEVAVKFLKEEAIRHVGRSKVR